VIAETAPDGRPQVGPFDRAGWREWLIANHASSRGVYLVSWRRASGRASVEYEEAVEEALCVGWIDSSGRNIDEERSIQWFAPRRPRSVWARSNKQRVARLTTAGLMLPAGLAAIEEAMLQWVVEARRPETRAGRINRIAERAARNERAYPPG
jgi:uncharacterized protein YdeI (YjbR/CyaY-like superfamily)